MGQVFELTGDDAQDAASIRELLGVGVVAGDLSAPEIARYARVHPSTAQQAIDAAVAAGILNPDGTIDDEVARELEGELSARRVAEVHADAARLLLTAGPERVADAVRHARAAGPLIPPEELIRQARKAGFLCLTLNDWASAELLFRLAIELSPLADDEGNTLQLRFLAVALNALGRMPEARDVLVRAADQAIAKGDWREATSVLVQLAIPVEWSYGNNVAAGLLDRVSRMDLNDETRLVLDSVRAMVEAWVPLEVVGDQQFAWVSRATLVQPISERVLNAAVGVENETRMVALMAWRETHRSPRFLVRRREVSQEALDLAQLLRFGYYQIESAISVGVDALESGDRPGYDSAVTISRWVAEQEGSQWLRWRAFTVLAGAALLDGDMKQAALNRELAYELGQKFDFPGYVAANTFLLVEEILFRDDPAEMAAFVVSNDEPAIAHPLGRLALAYREVRVGRDQSAERHLRLAMRQLDEEASYLLVACQASKVACLLAESGVVNVRDVLENLVTILDPWFRHVAVDSFGLWCEGPVALSLARIHDVLGNHDRARVMLQFAEPMARDMHDVRAIERIAQLRARFGPDVDAFTSAGFDLSERELEVLRGIVKGKTNPMIASELVFSLSTVRADTSEIFRKLGVSGRREAARRAVELGIVVLD